MEKSGSLVIALKGHPGTGKTTLAHSIATALRCPLLDKDDVRDCTEALQRSLAHEPRGPTLLNDLSYEVLWQMAKTQLQLGLSVVIDSPLSRRAHLDRLLQVAGLINKAHVIVVECRPSDEAEWRRRLERRGMIDDGSNWHKPGTWKELERLIEGYQGCTNYYMGDVDKLVLDTTGPAGVNELLQQVLQFIHSQMGPTDSIQ